MEQILEPVSTPSSVFIYRHDQKFTCTDYDKLSALLAESLFGSKEDQQLMIDWTYTETHPLIFEIPLKEKTSKNTFDFLMRYFDLIFLKTFQKYIDLPEVTIILALSSSGLRIYVVNIEISHDDYIDLCELMKASCAYNEEDFSVYLDSPSTFPFPSCHRPNETGDHYMPVRLVRVHFGFYQENGVWRSNRMENVTLHQKDKDSIFTQIVDHPSRWKTMVNGMMPNPQPMASYVHFPTQIMSGGGRKQIVLLRSFLNEDNYRIAKETILVNGKSFYYDFLKNNSNHIELYTDKSVLKLWYNRFRKTKSALNYFQNIDLKLRRLCPHLKDEVSPLAAVLKAYERPVYYAVYNLLSDKSQISKMHEQFPFLSKDLPAVPPKEARFLTFDTILYCAYLTGKDTMIGHLGTGYDWMVKTITSLSQLIEHVRWVQERLYPIARTLTKTYSWNPEAQAWFTLQEPVIDIQDNLRWSVEILDMYSKLPAELLEKFLEEDCIETVAREVFRNKYLQASEGNSMTEAPEMYGVNVPQYYFFNNTA